MKRIKLFIIIFLLLFVINVKADMGPPMIAEHKVMVTNKDGAVCYEYTDKGIKKTGVVIPYKTTLSVNEDVSGSYIDVSNDDKDDYNCRVKFSDVSALNQNFDLSKAEKITSLKAVVLAKGGLNMRKGPSVTYSKITTIPEHAVVTLTHRSGDYWFYCEYNGNKGWITGMDGYFGYESKEVLISDQELNLYSSLSSDKKVGKIPANTEITDYLSFVPRGNYKSYYVIYDGIKGYIKPTDYGILYKTEGLGKIKLIKDVEVRDSYSGELIKKLSANQEIEYSMMAGEKMFYMSSKKLLVSLDDDEFEYITKADIKVKTRGYIGEGLFGETKKEKEEEKKDDPKKEEKKEDEPIKQDDSMSTKELIIICLLAGIFLALTAIVILKLINSKKKVTNVSNEPKAVPKEKVDDKQEEKDEINEARKTIAKRLNNEVPKEEVKLTDEINKIKTSDDKEDK